MKAGDQMVVGVKVRRGQRRLPAAWEIGILPTEAGGGVEEEDVWGGITMARWVDKGHTSRAGSQGSVESFSGFFFGGVEGCCPTSKFFFLMGLCWIGNEIGTKCNFLWG